MAYGLDPASLLREVRKRMHLSQRELAKRAGASHSVVARIESGETDPRSRTLARILAAAGYELRCELALTPVVEPSMLEDVPRILRLTPERRLLEAANLSRFDAAVRRG